MLEWCVVCDMHLVHKAGRCAACYVYYRRHNGQDRPRELRQRARDRDYRKLRESTLVSQ